MIDLTPIFQAIISLIAVIITTRLIPWIKERTDEKQRENLSAIARIAVYAAEQMYGAGAGDEKLKYAQQVLKEAGYDVDTERLRAEIESAVYKLPLWYSPEPEEKPPEEEEQ